jgi:hypothetical protein
VTASVSLDRTGSDNLSIADLVMLAHRGTIRVPSFQRSFVWDAADVRKLFDSLYRGFPIGNVLLWRRPGPAGNASFGPVTIEVPEVPDALWVIDGQQRITSLYGCLSPSHKGVDSRFEVYFDLERERFVNPRRGVVSSRSIPVREALETRSLLNWLRQHEDDLEPEDLDRADRLGAVLRDYKVSVYIVAGDDQNLLREVFDRVNSAGKPMTRAQVFHALFASGEVPGSPGAVSKELEQLRFGSIPENRIVQSLLAIRGGDVLRDIRDEFAEDEDRDDWYDLTEQALGRAIGFLRDEGVPHLLLMPNEVPLPVLAAFFHLHPEPHPWNLRLLARWLWRGWVHGFGERGEDQTPALRRAVRTVHPLKGRSGEAPSEYDAVSLLLDTVSDRKSPEIPLAGFRTNKGDSRLILLALASLRPKDIHGETLDLVRILGEQGVGAVTELVQGRRSDAGARGFWPHGVHTTVPGIDRSVLASHLVSEDAAQAVFDVDEFVRLRSADLQELLGRFLDSRLEVGAIVRPPLLDLIATGNAEDD